MSSLFKEIDGLLERLHHLPYMVTIDKRWCQSSDEFCWNTDNNLEDLENRDGNTYSTEITSTPFEDDGCIIVNGDNGCGDTITHVFLKENEVKFDEV